MSEYTIFLTVTDGSISNLRHLHETIQLFKGDVQVTVRKKRVRRSDKQNRYFHALINILGKELGYRPEEMKSIIKCKFLSDEKIIELTGEIVPYIRETHLLTKSEFSEVVDAMIQWAAEMGIVLPSPNEQTEIQLQ